MIPKDNVLNVIQVINQLIRLVLYKYKHKYRIVFHMIFTIIVFNVNKNMY